MSFGPIKDRMRRPIPKVTERRGGGHAIELSQVRPDRQALAVIGSTIRDGDRGTALAPHRAADRPTPEHVRRFLRDSSPRSCRPEQPFETHLRYPLQRLHLDPSAAPFSDAFKTGSRATRTKQFTCRCTLGAPNFSNRIDDLVAELPPAY
jgi:hypothetical protein